METTVSRIGESAARPVSSLSSNKISSKTHKENQNVQNRRHSITTQSHWATNTKYESPFILSAKIKAAARIEAYNKMKRKHGMEEIVKQKLTKPSDWNLDTKTTALFDPKLAKRSIFPYGHNNSDSKKSEPTSTNIPTTSSRPNVSFKLTTRTHGTSPSNIPVRFREPPVITRYREAEDNVGKYQHLSQTTVPNINLPRQNDYDYTQQMSSDFTDGKTFDANQVLFSPPVVTTNPSIHGKNQVSSGTSPIGSVDLDSIHNVVFKHDYPNIQRKDSGSLRSIAETENHIVPDKNNKNQPFVAVTRATTRSTSPIDEGVAKAVLGIDQQGILYETRPRNTHHTQILPIPSDETHSRYYDMGLDNPIVIPPFKPSLKNIGGNTPVYSNEPYVPYALPRDDQQPLVVHDVNYFVDQIRRKLTGPLTLGGSTPTPLKAEHRSSRSTSASKGRHSAQPPLTPTALVTPATEPISSEQQLIAGMATLLKAVGDIVVANKHDSRHDYAYPYQSPRRRRGRSASRGRDDSDRSARRRSSSRSALDDSRSRSRSSRKYDHNVGMDRLTSHSQRKRADPLMFDLSGNQLLATKDDQHISSGFLQQHERQAAAAGKVIGPHLEHKSKSALLDVILQKLQAIDQSEREIHKFLVKSATKHNQRVDMSISSVDSFDPEGNYSVMRVGEKKPFQVKSTLAAADVGKDLAIKTFDDREIAHPTMSTSNKVRSAAAALPMKKSSTIKSQRPSHVYESESTRYLQQFPKVKEDPNANLETMRYMQELEMARRMKDVAFNSRGVSMSDVADKATEEIFQNMLKNISEEVNDIISEYSEKMVDKI